MPQAGDRRTAPRRAEPRREADRAMHYATQNLVAAALAAARTLGDDEMQALRAAAETYERAELDVLAVTS